MHIHVCVCIEEISFVYTCTGICVCIGMYLRVYVRVSTSICHTVFVHGCVCTWVCSVTGVPVCTGVSMRGMPMCLFACLSHICCAVQRSVSQTMFCGEAALQSVNLRGFALLSSGFRYWVFPLKVEVRLALCSEALNSFPMISQLLCRAGWL